MDYHYNIEELQGLQPQIKIEHKSNKTDWTPVPIEDYIDRWGGETFERKVTLTFELRHHLPQEECDKLLRKREARLIEQHKKFMDMERLQKRHKNFLDMERMQKQHKDLLDVERLQEQRRKDFLEKVRVIYKEKNHNCKATSYRKGGKNNKSKKE